MVKRATNARGGISLSVIIPALNEAGNIEPLVKRIDAALRTTTDHYEMICVDDNSTDTTASEVRALQDAYPIRLLSKPAREGKSRAIIDGAAMARYDLIGMIDADLQYPPEALVDMIDCMRDSRCGLVSTRRADNNAGALRRVTTGMIRVMYTMLFGITADVQSGLKVFRRDVIEQVPVDSIGAWTLDLELFLSAKRQGYTVQSVPITFAERTRGDSKINVISDGWSIIWYALRAKSREPWIGQIIRFGMVGIMNTVIDIGVYFVLTRFVPFFAVNQVGAKAISYSLAAINSFIVNRSFTFRARETSLRRFVPFLAVSLGGVVINSSVMYLSLHWLGLPELVGLAGATLAVFLWNFILSRRYVFAGSHQVQSATHKSE